MLDTTFNGLVRGLNAQGTECRRILSSQADSGESRDLGCNYVARRRTDAIGTSDRGGRRLPIARVGPMSISRARIVRRSVFRCTPSFSAALH
jgi:hypothetical protein